MEAPHKALKTFALAVPALFWTQSVWAESGTYEMLYGFLTNYTKLEQPGRTITAGSISGTQTVLKSSGGPFVEGANNVTECLVWAKRTDNSIDVESYCTSSYPSGDKLFTWGQRKQGDMNVGGGGAGKLQILGGTGQFADLTGSCSYRTNYLPGSHVVNHLDCKWQRP
jgi:hypothetical protein